MIVIVADTLVQANDETLALSMGDVKAVSLVRTVRDMIAEGG